MDDSIATRLSLTNLTINQFLLKMDIDPKDYNFSDFVNHYTKENNITMDMGIPVINEEFFLGLTARSSYSTAIFINPRVFYKRKNFSICHEVIHCLFDLNYRTPSQQFFNVEDRENFYSEDEIYMENLADAGAGIILLPDIKLIHYFRTNKSYHLISDECQISRSALYNRLVEFAIYSCGMSEFSAVKATKLFQSTGDRSIFRMYLTGAHSDREKQIVYDFENAI
ncbi:ImmA/IrrE family metallo-endopeptidase [Enterococcus sp. AZ196]|uniref:ImmA/IrrE family metallo-endopeptidase n=1 Tax=Enterococcus sp. AZ196 TaxID=2774659 RepID=UPI003D28F324